MMTGEDGSRCLMFIIALCIINGLVTDIDGAVEKTFQNKKVNKDPGYKKFSSLYNEVVIDLEQEPESPYDKLAVQWATETPEDLLHHPRIQDWCRRPDRVLSGLEGSPIEGFTLSSVIVLTTPGHTSRSSNTNDCNWQEFISRFPDEKLSSYEEVLSIYKNVKTNKNSFKIYDAVPPSVCKDGEISPLGIAQNIKLGEFVRKSYIHYLKTLRSLSRDTVYFSNSVKDQASYQGATAFLHGLLSEKQFISTGINKVQDNLCSSKTGMNCTCPTLSGHIDFTKPTNEQSVKIHLNEYFQLSKYLKFLDDLSTICTDENKSCPGPHCPDSTFNAALSVFKWADRILENITRSAKFTTYARLYSHPLLINLISTLLEPKHDFNHYSIKEFTFVNLLVALGIPVNTLPPPTSRISIEVHKRNGGRKRVFRILVNGEDFTPFVKVCAEEFSAYCHLQTLQNLKIYNYGLSCEKH